jgi:hypothetical protein
MMGWGGKFENDTSWEGPIVAVFGGYTPGLDDFSGAVSVLLQDYGIYFAVHF